MKKTSLLVFICCGLYAADPVVDGPKMGYVNSATGVRSVNGMVGASRLSAPVTGELGGAVILPGSDAAVAKNPSGALVRVDLKDGSISGLGLMDVGDFVVSPAGASVLARSASQLQVVSATGESKVEYASPGSSRLMAVSDQGATITVSVAEVDGEALYVVNEQGARRVFHSTGIAALAFVPGTRDAVFADKEGAIYLLKSDLQFTQIGTMPGVQALAGTTDGRVIAVAGKKVAALRADGSPASTVECSCDATIARPLGQSIFVLTDRVDGPMWLVDASAGELRVAFVPEAVNE